MMVLYDGFGGAPRSPRISVESVSGTLRSITSERKDTERYGHILEDLGLPAGVLNASLNRLGD